MAAESIAETMDHPLIIINKSTVPVGTGDWVADIITKSARQEPVPFWVVSNPEFLREGSAIHDFMNPDRVVLGSLHREAAEKVAQLHLPLRTTIQITDLRTAEMIKYASNAFLATRISFINEIATICERLGADVKEVAVGMGYDKRIGPHFLDAGLGFGGSCFPKDVRALEHMALVHGAHPQLLRAVLDINQHQRRQVIVKLRDMLDGLNERKVGLLGLSFKPNTDDMREAPSVDIARQLLREGAQVQAYDPVSMNVAERHAARCAPDRERLRGRRGRRRPGGRHRMERIPPPGHGPHQQSHARQCLIDGRNIWDPAGNDGAWLPLQRHWPQHRTQQRFLADHHAHRRRFDRNRAYPGRA